MTDIVCTSSNAKYVVESFPKDQPLIFAPDRNLGSYINKVTGRNMVLWDGTCEVHDVLETEHVIKLKVENPDAELIAHPECKAPILELADFIGSTTALINHTKNSTSKRFIVATESGILHQMMKESPDKEFIIVPSDETCACNDCPYMKLNTLEKIYQCMKNESPEILLEDRVIREARKPIVRMLEISKKANLITHDQD